MTEVRPGAARSRLAGLFWEATLVLMKILVIDAQGVHSIKPFGKQQVPSITT